MFTYELVIVFFACPDKRTWWASLSILGPHVAHQGTPGDMLVCLDSLSPLQRKCFIHLVLFKAHILGIAHLHAVIL